MNEVEESFSKIIKTKKFNIYLCGRQTGKSTFCRQQRVRNKELAKRRVWNYR